MCMLVVSEEQYEDLDWGQGVARYLTASAFKKAIKKGKVQKITKKDKSGKTETVYRLKKFTGIAFLAKQAPFIS